MIHRPSDTERRAFEERPHRPLLGTLYQRRVPILVGLGILLIAAVTLVLVLPRQFQSSLDILVRNKLPLSARVSATEQEAVDEQRMQSELALLRSPDLAARVVEPDYPAQPDATHTAADLKRHQAAVALFLQQLVTTVEPNSNLIHVIVTASDPHRAGELASRLLDVFFASQSEVAHPTPATSFFIAEANRARADWQEAQLSLDGFRLAHPVVPIGNAAEITLQIAALNHQIQRNDEQIDAAIGRILTGERKLITIPAHPIDPRNKSRNRSSAMPLLSAAQLNAMLAIYTDEQAILLTRPPTDPEAVRASLSLASQIAETRSAKRLADQAVAPDHDPAVNSLWQSTTDEIVQTGTELKALYATRAGLSNQLAGFQRSLDTTQRPSTILAGLQSKAATLQTTFRLADQRANEARIADAMDQQLRLNVAVASRPSFSNTATSPSPWLYGGTIALAVIFLAGCLTLFAGDQAREEEERDPDEYEDDDEDFGGHDAHGYAPEPQEDPQQQIPFPSRIRSSQSGAFLYAAPGGAVAPPPRSEPPAPHHDPFFEPTPESPSLSDSLSDPSPFPNTGPSFQPPTEAPEPEPYPSPAAEIFHPNQYTSGESTAEEPADSQSRFDIPPASRHASGETHAAVPSFFAAPPSSTLSTEPEEEYDRATEQPPYPSYRAHSAPEAITAAPQPAVEPAPEPEPSPSFSTPQSEPILTTPDPTPPWSKPAPEPTLPKAPPLSYWSSVDESTLSQPPAAPDPEPESDPAPQPAYAEPAYIRPSAPLTSETPLAPEPSAAAPNALPQAFTSTIRPNPFLTTPTSTLSAPAFRFNSPAAPPPHPVKPPATPKAVTAPEPTEPAPDPKLILTYAQSDPIELVPDPVLPPIKLPYKVANPEAPAPTPPPELSEFPLYRAPKPAPPRDPAPTPPASGTQTYEDMVRSLVYPEDTAPYVPPARPTPPRRAEAPPPPPVSPIDDDAPPFHYVRKSVPASPAPVPTPLPTQADHETLQSFTRRPAAAPPAPTRDDRTTYRPPAFEPAPPTPEPTRSSWIDVAPPPAPRPDSPDPQKRSPDRISAIRDQSSVRSSLRNSNFVDESGNRLTPSQRMKRGRPVPTVDKDGKVSYADYLSDQDKTRY